jgi:hypothetical protein
MKRCSHHKGVEGARAQKVSLVVRARIRDAACYAVHRYTGHPLRRNRVDAVAYQRVHMAHSRLMQNPMGPRRCLAGRDARREPQTNSRTIRKARNKADRPAKHRPEGFARKVPSCGVALLVEQNERSTFVARLASEHFSCKRGSQRVLHQPASVMFHM